MSRLPEWLRKIAASLHRRRDARGIGLALGGGGVRGLAHIGVLSVLDREHLPIRAIAGTSMGAIIGAAYALNPRIDKDGLTKMVMELDIKPPLMLGGSDEDRRSFFDRLRRFIDVERFLIDTMWGWGAFESTVVADALVKLTSNSNLEDARVPLAAVATDLLSGEKVVFTQGLASIALQASSALPGFFPPIRHEGRLLADGAFVDLVPVDVARQMGAQIVVAVDVDQETVRMDVRNGLQAFLRAVDIGARHHKHHHLQMADLVIRPEFGEPVDSLDFSKAELCIEAGERATELALPRLRDVLARGVEHAALHEAARN